MKFNFKIEWLYLISDILSNITNYFKTQNIYVHKYPIDPQLSKQDIICKLHNHILSFTSNKPNINNINIHIQLPFHINQINYSVNNNELVVHLSYQPNNKEIVIQ